MLGSKFKLPVKAEIVPYTLGNTRNVTINALRLCRGPETLLVVRYLNSKVKKHENLDSAPPGEYLVY